jgi:hypothetical protein
MYVWTKKAETDYRAKYPHRKNERKAGGVIKWDGRVLEAGTILDGYIARGWVCKVNEQKKKVVLKIKEKKFRCGNVLSETEKKMRWYKLIYFFHQPTAWTIETITNALGYSSRSMLSDFIKRHGKELAAKYGKLPYNKWLKASYWQEVMEAAQ